MSLSLRSNLFIYLRAFSPCNVVNMLSWSIKMNQLRFLLFFFFFLLFLPRNLRRFPKMDNFSRWNSIEILSGSSPSIHQLLLIFVVFDCPRLWRVLQSNKRALSLKILSTTVEWQGLRAKRKVLYFYYHCLLKDQKTFK